MPGSQDLECSWVVKGEGEEWQAEVASQTGAAQIGARAGHTGCSVQGRVSKGCWEKLQVASLTLFTFSHLLFLLKTFGKSLFR